MTIGARNAEHRADHPEGEVGRPRGGTARPGHRRPRRAPTGRGRHPRPQDPRRPPRPSPQGDAAPVPGPGGRTRAGRGTPARHRHHRPAGPGTGSVRPPWNTAARSAPARPGCWPATPGSSPPSSAAPSQVLDVQGNVISWASAGNVGFKGSRKSTPFAAQLAAEQCARRAMEHGLRTVEVHGQGPGLGS